MKWVLIYILTSFGTNLDLPPNVTTSHVEFDSKETCEQAEEGFYNLNMIAVQTRAAARIWADCFPK